MSERSAESQQIVVLSVFLLLGPGVSGADEFLCCEVDLINYTRAASRSAGVARYGWGIITV